MISWRESPRRVEYLTSYATQYPIEVMNSKKPDQYPNSISSNIYEAGKRKEKKRIKQVQVISPSAERSNMPQELLHLLLETLATKIQDFEWTA